MQLCIRSTGLQFIKGYDIMNCAHSYTVIHTYELCSHYELYAQSVCKTHQMTQRLSDNNLYFFYPFQIRTNNIQLYSVLLLNKLLAFLYLKWKKSNNLLIFFSYIRIKCWLSLTTVLSLIFFFEINRKNKIIFKEFSI